MNSQQDLFLNSQSQLLTHRLSDKLFDSVKTNACKNPSKDGSRIVLKLKSVNLKLGFELTDS